MLIPAASNGNRSRWADLECWDRICSGVAIWFTFESPGFFAGDRLVPQQANKQEAILVFADWQSLADGSGFRV